MKMKVLEMLEDDLKDADISKKVILDLIEAIHAAERRQADLDARIFAEEKRTLKVRIACFQG